MGLVELGLDSLMRQEKKLKERDRDRNKSFPERPFILESYVVY